MKYNQFLKSKIKTVADCGITVDRKNVNQQLFDFQKDIVMWALKKGRAAIFADCGLGKTPMQLEWAKHIHEKKNKPILILAPLAVSQQTKREGKKFNIPVHICKEGWEVQNGINITNYERLDHFKADDFCAIILDESSILKNYAGKMRDQITEFACRINYRLACTATPSPNDYMELGCHAEIFSEMSRNEMLAMFFVHDSNDTAKWRLKGHAKSKFWEWLATWSVALRKPSDLGYKDDKFILPELKINEMQVKCDPFEQGKLFIVEAKTLQERRQARRDSLIERVNLTASLVNQNKEKWIIWCDLNKESNDLAKAIDGAVEIVGSDKPEYKENTMMDFSKGNIRVLVTKPSIAGFGMNWQHCRNVAFVGLSDSYERYYQAIRRCWRFGQKRKVNCYIITSEMEGAIVENIKRKEKQSMEMFDNIVKRMAVYSLDHKTETKKRGKMRKERGKNWEALMGDSCEMIKKIDDDSIGYSIFSPPFAELYVYSDDHRDLGNSQSYHQFFEHFGFLINDLFRVTKKGRCLSVHCIDIPAMKERDGYIGLKDFPGDLIKAFQKAGFIYHSRHVIWKDPLIEATRTKAIGLMHKQLTKDSARCRAGLPDYLITFRKPGDNKDMISHPDGFTCFYGDGEPKERGEKYSHHVWRKYASPIWMDIRQGNTLNKTRARGESDEKHICPLQLDVIERCMDLWSKEDDLVLSPFMGIGSEGYVAVKNKRKFIGMELKESYFKEAIKNLSDAENHADSGNLFDIMEGSNG